MTMLTGKSVLVTGIARPDSIDVPAAAVESWVPHEHALRRHGRRAITGEVLHVDGGAHAINDGWVETGVAG